MGFQERSDTYTKKLAYIIYYDEKGKLRKEKSWNSWRDDGIDPVTEDNIPTSGFVLNKKAGGYSTGWNHRQTYVRIYDPRGFEFEITIPNLLYILENTNSIKGKGLEGEFIYGWDGVDLLLIPTLSPDYKEILDYNKSLKKSRKFKGTDMVVGGTYLNKNNEELIYIGRYDYHGHRNSKKEYFFYDRSAILDWDWQDGKKVNIKYGEFLSYSSLSKNIIDVTSRDCVGDYADIFDRFEYYEDYNPYDPNKDEYIEHTLESFVEFISNQESFNGYINIECYISGRHIDEGDNYYDERKRYYPKEGIVRWHEYENKNSSYGYHSRKYIEKECTLEEFFNKYKPQWKKEYLKDGKLRKIKYYE